MNLEKWYYLPLVTGEMEGRENAPYSDAGKSLSYSWSFPGKPTD
jgi:hypothetical protein